MIQGRVIWKIEPENGLHRPYLRNATVEKIMENYRALGNGDYMEINTREIIKGPIELGHIYGFEHRRLELAASQLGLTQSQFNDYINARPQFFKPQNMNENRRRNLEMQGKDIPEAILDDMKEFSNK